MDADYHRRRTKETTDAHRELARHVSVHWDSIPYGEKELVLEDYLYDLHMYINNLHIYTDKWEVKADLEILRNLLTKLKLNIAEGEICYIQYEIAVFRARQKVGMMLQKLFDSKNVEYLDCFRVMQSVVDWKGYLYFTKELKELKEKALAVGAHFAEQIKALEEFNVEDIDVKKLDDFEKRLQEYLQEEEDACEISLEKTDCISSGPDTCAFIEQIMCKLTDICLPDDDIKEERSDGVQIPIQAFDSVQIPIQAVDSVEEEKPDGVQIPIQAVGDSEEMMENEESIVPDCQGWIQARYAYYFHREFMRQVLVQWDSFSYGEKESVLADYLYDLYMYINNLHICTDKWEVKSDLKILTNLLTKLKLDIAEGERCYIQYEIAVFYARKKVGMVLQKLDKHIKMQGKLSDEDLLELAQWKQELAQRKQIDRWKQYLDFVKNTNELKELKEKALAVGAEFAEQIKALEEFNVEDIDVDKFDDIEKRLQEYLQEEEAAYKISLEKADCISSGPDTCAFIEQILCKLTDLSYMSTMST